MNSNSKVGESALNRIREIQREDIPEDINGLALAHYDKSLLSINRTMTKVDAKLASIDARLEAIEGLLRGAVGNG